MPQTKQLSIIIVAYRSAGHIEKCVASIYEKLGDLLTWEIIIVNNDRNQNIAELPLDFSKIKLIDHKKNIGFGSGMNLGAKLAEGKFLLILNPDTQIITGNITDVLEEFLKNEEVGIIGGEIIGGQNKKQEWSAGRELSFYDLARNNLGLNRSKIIWNSSQKIACDWVAGTALFIQKDLFDKLGGFDENFFMYFEDMDLCRRARIAGKKILFFPNFKIMHDSGASYIDKKLQKSHYYDSMEYYFKKNCSWSSYIIVKLTRKFLDCLPF